jgi:hypothetical protein
MRDSKNTYTNLLYRTEVGTQENNCYAYAIDHYDNSGGVKLQPGDLAGMSGPVDISDCKDMKKRVQADAKAMGWTLREISNSTACSSPSIKIASVIAPGEDFHWYRYHTHVLYTIKRPRTVQDIADQFGVPLENIQVPLKSSKIPKTLQPGDTVYIRHAHVWSHKQGFSPAGPLLVDACGKIIKDPATACRKYGNRLNYNTMCTYYCLTK